MSRGTVIVTNATKDFAHDRSQTIEHRFQHVGCHGTKGHIRITQKEAETRETNGWRSAESNPADASMCDNEEKKRVGRNQT